MAPQKYESGYQKLQKKKKRLSGLAILSIEKKKC